MWMFFCHQFAADAIVFSWNQFRRWMGLVIFVWHFDSPHFGWDPSRLCRIDFLAGNRVDLSAAELVCNIRKSTWFVDSALPWSENIAPAVPDSFVSCECSTSGFWLRSRRDDLLEECAMRVRPIYQNALGVMKPTSRTIILELIHAVVIVSSHRLALSVRGSIRVDSIVANYKGNCLATNNCSLC